MFNGLVLSAEIEKVAVIGDVHGCADALQSIVDIAQAHAAYPVFLGDIVGRGEDSLKCMSIVASLVGRGSACLVVGNHDADFADAFFARAPRSRYAGAIFSQMSGQADASRIAAEFCAIVDAAPRWVQYGRHSLFVHAAFDVEMLKLGTAPSRILANYACTGETTSAVDEFGCQIRNHSWVHKVPFGLDVYFGHDVLSRSVPKLINGALGGCAYAMDTGCVFHGTLSGALINREIGFLEFIKATTSRPLMSYATTT